MDDLLELSGDDMYYVTIEERLVESLRIKWKERKDIRFNVIISNCKHRGGQDKNIVAFTFFFLLLHHHIIKLFFPMITLA